MFDLIAGLPLHPLVVHAVEVVVPAAALVVLVAVLWPRFRRWSYALPLLLSLAALALVPVATESGEALQRRVGETPLIETHADMAEALLPWVIGLAVVSAGVVWWTWQERRVAVVPVRSDGPGASPAGTAASGAHPTSGDAAVAGRGLVPRWLPIVLIVAGLATSVGTTVQAIRIGHSGATAVWSGVAEMTPRGEDGVEVDDD